MRVFLQSHPLWVRGLKLKQYAKWIEVERSHPLWVRGLKLGGALGMLLYYASHPLWVRGLKRGILVDAMVKALVAPLVGAWIETP